MARLPSALKLLLLCGQLLATLTGLPLILIGVRMYLNLAHILIDDLSTEALCYKGSPTQVILGTFTSDIKACISRSEQTNLTTLQESCDTELVLNCDFIRWFEWLGFLLRPWHFGILVYKYFLVERFVTLRSKKGFHLRRALARIGLQDFLMTSLQNGHVQHAISFLAAVSLISYLREMSSFFLAIETLPGWLHFAIGLTHCGACAEGLVILGFVLIKMHAGIGTYKRILFVFTWDLYLILLKPLSLFWMAMQLVAYLLLSLVHLLVMDIQGSPLYLICVLGYPLTTLLCAIGNAKTPVTGSRARESQVAPRKGRPDRTCGFTQAMIDIAAEDLLYIVEVDRATSFVTNYDLFRLFRFSNGRVNWAPNDTRSKHIVLDDQPRGVAYEENGDVHIQLNDAALNATEICEVKFDPYVKRTKTRAEVYVERAESVASFGSEVSEDDNDRAPK